MHIERSRFNGEIQVSPVEKPAKGSFRLSDYYPIWTDTITQAAVALNIDTSVSASFSDLAPSLETVTYARAQQRSLPYQFVVLLGTQSVGKTTIRENLVARHGFANFRNLVSRPPRPNETDGVTAHFVAETTLDTMEAMGQLIAPPADQSHSSREPRYRSAASTQEFLDLYQAGRPFVIERRLPSWETMEANLRMMPDIDPEVLDRGLVVFLLPPSLDILLARAIEKAVQASEVIDGDEIAKQIERTFGTDKASMIPNAASRSHIVFLVNDDLTRITDKIVDLCAETDTIIKPTRRREAA